MFSFIRTAKYFLLVSAVLLVASVVLLIKPGPRLSIEFTGGTLMEVSIPTVQSTDVRSALQEYEKQYPDHQLGNVSVATVNGQQGRSFVMRLALMTNEQHVQLVQFLDKKFGKDVKELQYTTIGPSLSANLRKNALIALVVASIAIIVYLAFAFRNLPRKLNPWKFGVLAVLAFLHDVVVTAGLFVIISRFTAFEFDPLFVTALLTILAYSANDTVVIFDRIRANLTHENRAEDLGTAIDRALRETVTRTFNTSMAALIMLTSLFFLGAESIRWFILALICGTIIGAYSSYFIAAPLLVLWKWKKD